MNYVSSSELSDKCLKSHTSYIPHSTMHDLLCLILLDIGDCPYNSQAEKSPSKEAGAWGKESRVPCCRGMFEEEAGAL